MFQDGSIYLGILVACVEFDLVHVSGAGGEEGG